MQFDARLKTFGVKGDLKVDSQGEIAQEPELVIQFAVTLTADTIEQMTELAQLKAGFGQCTVDVDPLQGALDLGVPPRAANAARRLVNTIAKNGGGSMEANGERVDIPARK